MLWRLYGCCITYPGPPEARTPGTSYVTRTHQCTFQLHMLLPAACGAPAPQETPAGSTFLSPCLEARARHVRAVHVRYVYDHLHAHPEAAVDRTWTPPPACAVPDPVHVSWAQSARGPTEECVPSGGRYSHLFWRSGTRPVNDRGSVQHAKPSLAPN